MLASFKSPSGKSLKWAKEIVVGEEVVDASVEEAIAGWMTRQVGNKNVQSASSMEADLPPQPLQGTFVGNQVAGNLCSTEPM